MCNAAYVQAGLAVAGAVQGYREKKAQNSAIRRDQDTSRRNADKGYLHDLQKIDNEKILADQEKAISKLKVKSDREAEIAQSLNLGFGNSTKIVQSIGGLYDDDWNSIDRDYSKDMVVLADQKTEAYANLSKTYNSLTPPIDPSRTGLIIGVASSASQGYYQNQKDETAKKNSGG